MCQPYVVIHPPASFHYTVSTVSLRFQVNIQRMQYIALSSEIKKGKTVVKILMIANRRTISNLEVIKFPLIPSVGVCPVSPVIIYGRYLVETVSKEPNRMKAIK